MTHLCLTYLTFTYSYMLFQFLLQPIAWGMAIKMCMDIFALQVH